MARSGSGAQVRVILYASRGVSCNTRGKATCNPRVILQYKLYSSKYTRYIYIIRGAPPRRADARLRLRAGP